MVESDKFQLAACWAELGSADTAKRQSGSAHKYSGNETAPPVIEIIGLGVEGGQLRVDPNPRLLAADPWVRYQGECGCVVQRAGL